MHMYMYIVFVVLQDPCGRGLLGATGNPGPPEEDGLHVVAPGLLLIIEYDMI